MDSLENRHAANSRDQEICLLLNRHDVRGLELLFEAYYNPLVLWANSFLNNLSNAEDLVQEFFIALWKQKIYQKFDPDRLSAFLRVIIKNRSLNYLRKKDVLNRLHDIETVELAWEEYNERFDRMIEMVDREISKLPARSQEIIRMVFQEGLKYQQIADRLHISLSTVKTLSAKSLKKLKESLDDNLLLSLLFCFYRGESLPSWAQVTNLRHPSL